MQGHEVRLNETSGKYQRVDDAKPLDKVHVPPTSFGGNPHELLKPPEQIQQEMIVLPRVTQIQ